MIKSPTEGRVICFQQRRHGKHALPHRSERLVEKAHANDAHNPVRAMRNSDIVRERRAVTADTALRLSAYFGNSADFWLGIQMDYDLDSARINNGATIEREVRRQA
jgi:addiction module HigA family antidote